MRLRGWPFLVLVVVVDPRRLGLVIGEFAAFIFGFEPTVITYLVARLVSGLVIPGLVSAIIASIISGIITWLLLKSRLIAAIIALLGRRVFTGLLPRTFCGS